MRYLVFVFLFVAATAMGQAKKGSELTGHPPGLPDPLANMPKDCVKKEVLACFLKAKEDKCAKMLRKCIHTGVAKGKKEKAAKKKK